MGRLSLTRGNCVNTKSLLVLSAIVCVTYFISLRNVEEVKPSPRTVKTREDPQVVTTKSSALLRSEKVLHAEPDIHAHDDHAVNILLDPANSHIDRRKIGSSSSNYTLREAWKTIEKPSFTFDKSKDCPTIEQNPILVGHLPQALMLIEKIRESEVAAIHTDVKPGGLWSPTDCKPVHKVAIIFPFRDRQAHLTRLLAFLLPILKKQRLDFRIIVTEQYGAALFNKGRIMNAAFVFAEKLGVDCVFFHDVDMFPQDDRIPYGCPSGPFHLGAFVNSLGYTLMYQELVGGVLGFPIHEYRHINGFSNLFWGWGGEDDDMGTRIMSQNWTILRPDDKVARFSMIKHMKRKRSSPKLVYKLLKDSGTRMFTDGVNVTSNWTIRKVIRRPLYYHLYVDVGPVPAEWRSTS